MSRCEDPQVAVVIPNWNGARFLRTCLMALRAQEGVRLQAWLVDNGSTDDSLALVREEFPEVAILALDSNRGFSAAVNAGISASQAPFVALLNNDTEADPRWLACALRTLERHPAAGYVASRIMNFHQRGLLDSAGDFLTRTGLPLKRGADQDARGEWLQERRVMGASAGAAVYRRSAFARVGLFDEEYFLYLEDVDWCLRAGLLGLPCVYAPDAVVYHVEGGSDPERQGFLDRGESARRNLHTPQRTYWITRNRVRLLCKNFPAALAVRLAPWVLYGFARSFLFHALKSGLAASFLRGLWHGLAGIPRCLELRREIQRRRTVSPGQLARIWFA